MRKRIIGMFAASVCLLTVASTAVFAEEPKKVEPLKPVVIEMTMLDAIKYAGEHNSTIRDLKKAYDDY